MNQPQHLRSDYRHFQPLTTRWHDNDVYGHVNNVTYYSFIDSAVNTYLIEVGGLDIHNGSVVGFVVSSSCDYFASIAFPERIEIGLRVGRAAVGKRPLISSWSQLLDYVKLGLAHAPREQFRVLFLDR